MRKTLLLIIVTLIFVEFKAQTTSIPDANFEQVLIYLGLDSGPVDGVVPTANIDTVTRLPVANINISDLTGIQDFAALNLLFCYNNQLTNLDVTQNTALTNLQCENNQLTSLDLTQNTDLDYLDCFNNQLTNLDVTQNTALAQLYCYNNQLTNLDVTQNVDLSYLECYNNQLTSLDVTQNTSLYRFACYDNQLTNIDVTQNSALSTLLCSDNQVTSLDVTQNTSLISFGCSDNQLTSLDVTQNTSLLFLHCRTNQLTSLDVIQNIDLYGLMCSDNQLTSLDVVQNIDLDYLICDNNQLTSLDISQNIYLTKLLCDSNQLNCLNVKNGANSYFSEFKAFGNPSLSCIDVDDVAWSTANWMDIDAGTSFSFNCNNACSPVGINEDKFASGFSLYPNPASNIVEIDFKDKEQLVNISVLNIQGQQVLSNEYRNANNIRLNVKDLSSGIYFAKITTDKGSKTIKFVKQ